MEQKDFWVKLSGSINYFIKDIWKENLLQSSDTLLEDFLDYAFGETDDCAYYTYLNKKTNEVITLDEPTIDRVKKAFIERIEKKKLKYADELDQLQLDLDSKKDNVVDFSDYKK